MAIEIRKNAPETPKAVAARKPITPVVATKKRPMTIRLDEDCLEAWRATGRDWQGRMNAYLRKGVSL